MNTPRLEHLGIAVNDLEAAEKIYTDLTGAPPYKREEVADENVITSFFETANGAKIELLATTSPDGPIGRHIERLAAERGLTNLTILTRDMNDFAPEHEPEDQYQGSEGCRRKPPSPSRASWVPAFT